MKTKCAIIGTGPAALLAADLLSSRGVAVQMFERRGGPGWKLLVAGASGLNVTYDCPSPELASHYFHRQKELAEIFQRYGREEWLTHLEGLGEPTFRGTSRRFFLDRMKASSLLASWVERLRGRGVEIHYNEELAGISRGAGWTMTFRSGRCEQTQSILLALGGGSWEDSPPAWPEILKKFGVGFSPFAPANAGYSFVAPKGFFASAEGKPIKGLTLSTAKGKRQGELMITRYGLEGTPIYSVGCPGPAKMDLKPDLDEAKLRARLDSAKGSVRERIEKAAKLSPGALEIALALLPSSVWESTGTIAHALKNVAIELLEPRPLSESISSRGGLHWDELGSDLELSKMPGVFCAGEMVDWDAPTGGFLIQASVSMGFVAAQGILRKSGS
jgi:uncharacterized flavoprotein (TIGR03862 family)